MTTLRVQRTVFPPPQPTRRACAAAAALGALVADVAPATPVPDRFTVRLPPSGRILITGPSGSGKSTLLRDLAATAETHGWTVVREPARQTPNRPAIDLAPGDVPDAMRLLAAAGLADLRCFIRRPNQLSTGQHARLLLALTLERARRRADAGERTLLVLDEFAATLDQATAASVASLLRNAALRAPELRLAIATPNPGLAEHLRPTTHVECDAMGRLHTAAPPGPATHGLRINRGTLEHYAALAPLHYRPGPPANPEHVLVATHDAADRPAGVLVVARPTLNGLVRNLAWPGRYTGPTKTEAARRINRELRCIARVIVDPCFRGLGVARSLVAAYLAQPVSPATEAIAAMGKACPFFERAGMTAYHTPPAARHARLLDAFAHAGVEPWRLATPASALLHAERNAGRRFIERELRTWARSSGATLRFAHAPTQRLLEHACRAVCAAPVGYAHSANAPEPG